jgi:WS/DGAT/MGAT family acyltransferase
MPVDRLSALDESFLRLESDDAHMHVGWTLLMEGEPPAVGELRAHVAGRLDRLPRFRRRVLRSPLHDPVWADDETFDIANHVIHVTVPAPGGPREVRELTGRLLSRPLDLDRPLWRLCLVDGLRDGGFAVVGQAHHALVDGIAALEVAMLLLDADPDAPATTPSRWLAVSPPALAWRALATAGERLRVARSLGSLGIRALTNPGSVRAGISSAARLVSALAPLATPAPQTCLNCPIGPERAVAFAEFPLEAAKKVGRDNHATINDVVLAAASLALGAYLRRAGETQPWLRALVPVSVRAQGAAAELGNRISFLLVELPVAERSPAAALDAVCVRMHAHKRADRAAALDGLLRGAGIAPLAARDAIAWVATRPQTFNTVISNLTGPQAPLYLLGRRVHAAYPAVPLVRGHGLSVGVLSYDGTIHVGLYAHRETVPDVVELARDFTRAFDALRLPPLPPPPGRKRILPRDRERLLEQRVLV